LTLILSVSGGLCGFYVELAEKLGQMGRTIFHRQFEFSYPLEMVYKGIASKNSSKTKMLSQYCNIYNVYLNHILEISPKSIPDTPVPNEIQF